MAGNIRGVGSSSEVMPVFPTPNTVKRFLGSGLAFVWSYTGGPILERTFAHAQRTVVHHVKSSINRTSNPNIDRLLAALTNLEPENAAALVDDINPFLSNPNAYLSGATDENGELIQLTPFVRNAFTALARNLGHAGAQQDLEIARQFLTYVQSQQMGLLQQVRGLATVEGFGALMESMGLKKPGAAAENGVKYDAEVDEAQRRILLSLARSKEAQQPMPSAATYKIELSRKFDEITDLAVMMSLTRLIFPGENWKTTFCQIYATACRRVSAGEQTVLEDAFNRALEETFFGGPQAKSTFERLQYWFHLKVSARLLKRYIKALMAHFRADLMKFLDRSPEERMNDVFATVMKPLHEHMTAYYSYNKSLAEPGVVLEASIDLKNQEHFKNLRVNNETIDQILFHFAHLLVENYTPKISWSNDLASTLDKWENWFRDIYSSKLTNGILTVIKVSLAWSTFLISWPFEQLLNRGIKWKIKREVKTVIQSNLYKTGGSAGKTHSHIQHLINLFLMEKLSVFNANGKGADHAPMSLRSSPTRIRDLQSVVDILFASIPLSMATNDPADLHHYFHGGPVARGKRDAYTTFKNQFTPTVSLEILRGMEHFFYDDQGLLSEFVWYTASNIAETMRTDAGDSTQKEEFQDAMNATETEMHKQLRMAVTTVVKEGVKTALDPSKKFQNELDAAMDGLRRQTETFLTTCQTVDVATSDIIAGAWSKLAKAVLEMKTQLEDTGIPKIRRHGLFLFKDFSEKTKALIARMSQIDKARDDKSRLEKQLADELDKVVDQIQRAPTREEKSSLLNLLSGKSWITLEFKNQILHYRDFLEKFLTTTPDKPLLRLEQSRADQFLANVVSERTQLQAKIDSASRDLQEHIVAFKSALAPLQDWKETIKSFKITSDDVTNLVATGIKVTGLPIEKYAVRAVMTCLEELIHFKQRPYHLSGFAIRSMQAYNALPDRAE